MRPMWQVICILLGSSTFASAQEAPPLSAIDWLSDSVASSEAEGDDGFRPETALSASIPTVSVTSLDVESPNSLGIIDPETAGLPSNLWDKSDEITLIELVGALPPPKLPVLRDLLVSMMIAETTAPLGSTKEGEFYLARVDQLLALGRLEEVRALLQAGDIATPEAFRRYFDVSLLTGSEDDACDIMSSRPSVAPTYPARIFCLARSGDWPAAALTLNTHRALGDISDEDELLLSLFLDPEVVELQVEIQRPSRVTPLVFRMREAIGESLPTIDLPLAFAHADLRDTNGWKVQLDAAERLARQGALDPSVLKDLYTSRRASASGGVWDRVDAFQKFDQAIIDEDRRAITTSLPGAYKAMAEIGYRSQFATLYADDLREIRPTRRTREILQSLELLSVRNIEATLETVEDPFLRALAEGRPQEVRAVTPKRLAVQSAFNGAAIPERLALALDQGKAGEVILQAMAMLDAGLDGDLAALTDAVAVFRKAGMELTARQIGIQFLILDQTE